MTDRLSIRRAAAPTLRRRTVALFVLFSLPGVALSSWVTRTPDVRDLLEASTAEMGLVLLGLSAGSMIGILCSGALVRRWGTRFVIGTGAALVTASMVTIGAGAATASALIVAIGLGVFGLGMGAGEVALNVEGSEIERLSDRSVLTAMHGFFSIGTVVGALGGLLATALRVPVLWHLLLVAAVIAAGALWGLRGVPGSTADGSDAAEPGRTRGRVGPGVWRDPTLVIIGVIVLALALAEGSANDWLPLLMVDGHGYPAASGSLVYVAFATSMAFGRFVGNALLDRAGHALVLAVSAAIGAVGLALVIFSDDPILAGAAALLWGLGASLGFPVAISAAATSGPDPARRVSMVATLGYVAFLVGPPALGFLGEHFGLRNAMIIVLVLVACAVVLALLLQVFTTRRGMMSDEGDSAVTDDCSSASTG